MSRIKRRQQAFDYVSWLADQRGWTIEEVCWYVQYGDTPEDVRAIEARFLCVDCGWDTMPQYPYVLRDDLWSLAGMEPDGGMLCIDCLEHRLGRELTGADFDLFPMETAEAAERYWSEWLCEYRPLSLPDSKSPPACAE